MPSTTFWGIFSIGFVFGYLLYYAVRHTQGFSIDMLSIAIGAIGGATVIGLLGNVDGWLGPYGIGIGVGFLFYLILSLIFLATGWFAKVDNIKLLAQTVLGVSRSNE
ncbi:hypothetical protein JW960_05930 [candidate division KSB1 bacterium]|nr:hypothetical protein [candidate division KSB1 bacterium]